MTSVILAAALETQFNSADSPETLYRVFALGVAVTIALWLWWFIIRPKEKAMDGQGSQEQKSVEGDAGQTSGDSSPVVQAGEGSVVSVNQKGGITAGRIIIGHPDRTFGGSVSTQIVERLKDFAGTKFRTSSPGGGEPVRFEDELNQLLTFAGWERERSHNTITAAPPLRGLLLYPEGSAAIQTLAAILTELGFQLRIENNAYARPVDRPSKDELDDGVVEINIGI